MQDMWKKEKIQNQRKYHYIEEIQCLEAKKELHPDISQQNFETLRI